MTRHRALAPTTSSPTPRATLARVVSRHPTLLIAITIVALTAVAAAVSAVWPQLGPGRQPRPTLHGTPGEVVSIFVTNARTLIAPLLLAAGRWHTGRTTRHVGDVVVAALVISNPVMVGLALGRHSLELLEYLPHLPIEDAALAIAASAWIARRVRSAAESPPPASVARCTAVTAAVALLAAFVETYAVPRAS